MLALMPQIKFGSVNRFQNNKSQPAVKFQGLNQVHCDTFQRQNIPFKGNIHFPIDAIAKLNDKYIKLAKTASLEELQNTIVWNYNGELKDLLNKFKPKEPDSFYADFAHELNGAYLSQQMVNLISLEKSPNARQEAYKIGINIAKHAHQTVKLYQYFIDKGLNNPNKQFSLKQVFNLVQESLNKKAEAKNIKLNIHNEKLLSRKDAVTNQAYKNYIIMSNVIENAVKYSPENSAIDIAFKPKNGNLHLIVKDNGIGIPDKDKECIIQLGARGSNVGDITGTGHGLFRIHKILESKSLPELKIKSPLYPDEPVYKGTEIDCSLLTMMQNK